MNFPQISIITVNYNNSLGLEKTIFSVIAQTYENIEFIIIDGGSSDKSVSIIEKYKNKINYFVSESDSGIYDGMNKGISFATSEWCVFVNSGDTFCDQNVLLDVVNSGELNNENSLVYGHATKDGNTLSALSINMLEKGVMFACHQSMFFRLPIKYDLSYKIYGDYELVLRIYEAGKKLVLIERIICERESGGVSSKVSIQKRLDKYRAVFNHLGLKFVIIALLWRLSLIFK